MVFVGGKHSIQIARTILLFYSFLLLQLSQQNQIWVELILPLFNKPSSLILFFFAFLSNLSNKAHFLWVYRRDNPRGMLEEHE